MKLYPAKPLDAFRGIDDRRRTRRARGVQRQKREKQRLEKLRQENARLRQQLDASKEVEPMEPPLETESLGRALPWVKPVWGPPVAMGSHLQVQASKGHRAAVITLKPGLYLVAELPENYAHPNFGFVPLLAPMMIRAAKKVLEAQTPPSSPAAPPAPLLLPGPSTPPAPLLGWEEPVEIGCARCNGGCRR